MYSKNYFNRNTKLIVYIFAKKNITLEQLVNELGMYRKSAFINSGSPTQLLYKYTSSVQAIT